MAARVGPHLCAGTRLEKRVRRVTTSSRASNSAEMSRPDPNSSNAFTLRRLAGESCSRRCREGRRGGRARGVGGGIGANRQADAATWLVRCEPRGLHACLACGTAGALPGTGLGLCSVHRSLDVLRLHHRTKRILWGLLGARGSCGETQVWPPQPDRARGPHVALGATGAGCAPRSRRLLLPLHWGRLTPAGCCAGAPRVPAGSPRAVVCRGRSASPGQRASSGAARWRRRSLCRGAKAAVAPRMYGLQRPVTRAAQRWASTHHSVMLNGHAVQSVVPRPAMRPN